MARKKRLLMILGAGSSVACGMPSVAEINTLMASWAREFAETWQFTNFYDRVWRALERHLASGFQSARQSPNFERALGDLLALMHWVRPSPEGSALATLFEQTQPPPNLSFINSDRYGPYIEVKTMIAHLAARLACEMRKRCIAMPTDLRALEQWRAMLRALRGRFDVAIYNLNYDTVALSGWPDAFTGFDIDGRFDPAAVYRRDWEGIFHLHGSVHFSLANSLGDHIVWRNDLKGAFLDSNDRFADYGSDGKDFLPTTLIAGGFKLDQLLTEPFQAYRAALTRDIALADAIMIGGYGFGDTHVNRALCCALALSRARPPVLVLDWAGPQTEPMDVRQDAWARELRQALFASSPFVGAGTSVIEMPAVLAEQGRCEVSSAHRVAIWYGGFGDAAPLIDRLTHWLH
ncbi:hypothetical protein FHX10_006752 [Rhizobium sp. BK591]|uniref:SIR2 family protein n=1 Tax=Rhizobium sp. BK591 TaxID=2586985 RepID=UPI00179EFDA0|nr:SIR2 family protein [Rhizobium sp. BK591]MBB3747196.1 hypothetical protein [Rhizobium sp. BK591]